VWWEKWVVEKPVNPMDGLRVECVVGNRRHDNMIMCVVIADDAAIMILLKVTEFVLVKLSFEKHN